MATVIREEVDTIGTIAGCIWTYLDEHGQVTMPELIRELDAPRDSVMQGVGWLAREGKVSITKEARSRKICLT